MAATLRDVFADVVLVARPGPAGGNLVLLAAEAPIPTGAIPTSRDATPYSGAALTRVLDGARALRDDHAPADQLLSPQR